MQQLHKHPPTITRRRGGARRGTPPTGPGIVRLGEQLFDGAFFGERRRRRYPPDALDRGHVAAAPLRATAATARDVDPEFGRADPDSTVGLPLPSQQRSIARGLGAFRAGRVALGWDG
jgi:hypothetical protein